MSAEMAAVADLARNLGLDKLSPAARSTEAHRRVDDVTWRALVGTGLTTFVAEEGQDGVLDAVTHMIAAEGFAYGDPGIALAAMWSGSAALLLMSHGTPEQAAHLSTDPLRRGSIAFLEGFGRGAEEWTTTIAIRADGHIEVRGKKVAVPFGREAAEIIVIGNDPSSGELRAALVPKDHPGMTLEPNVGALALDALESGAVTFDVVLPGDALLGGGTADSTALALSVERIRLLVASVAVGTSQRAIDYASKYATERIAFGRPIAGFQGVSFLLAEKHIRAEAARVSVSEAASLIDEGLSEAHSLADIRREVRDAINYACDVAAMTTRDAVQVLGGHGFITDHPVELWYRSAAALATLDFDPLCSSFSPVL